VYDNRTTLNVKIVNLSLGTDATYATGDECDRSEPALAAAVKNLVSAGITVFAASGNRGLGNALSAPACLTGVIAVGAVYDSNVGKQPPGATTYQARWGTAFGNCYDQTTDFDQVTCFTNSSSRLDIVAPGAPITSAAANGQNDTYWGTSQASPAAAGIAALMLECNPTLTPANIKDILVKTGVPRVDKKNGLSFPSVRALEAVRAACGDDDAGAGGAPTGSGGSTGSGGAVVSPGGATASGGTIASGGTATSSGGTATTTGGGIGAGGGPTASGGTVASGGVPLATGGAATATGGVVATGAPRQSDDGCGCRVPGSRRDGSGAHAIFAALAALFVRRRSLRTV